MTKFKLLLFSLAFLILAIPLSAYYPPQPPPGVYILDLAEVVDDDLEQKINTLCAQVDQQTTAQMAVLTIETTGAEHVSYYATELGNRWGVGQKAHDNGLMMVVAVDDRQVFTASGAGMEAILPDAVLDKIYRGVLVPNFRKERYGKGIYGAIQHYAAHIQEYYAAEFEMGRPPAMKGEESWFNKYVCKYFWVFIIIGFLAFALWIIFSKPTGGGSGSRSSGSFWSSSSSSSSSSSWSSSSSSSSSGFGGGSFSGGGAGGGW